MLTTFGKICRKIRIDQGILMYDMARELGVSSAFLSKVENGKSKPVREWAEQIAEVYDLDGDTYRELVDAIEEARAEVVETISAGNQDDMDMILKFARQLGTMSESKKETFAKLLERKRGVDE